MVRACGEGCGGGQGRAAKGGQQRAQRRQQQQQQQPQQQQSSAVLALCRCGKPSQAQGRRKERVGRTHVGGATSKELNMACLSSRVRRVTLRYSRSLVDTPRKSVVSYIRSAARNAGPRVRIHTIEKTAFCEAADGGGRALAA